MECCSVFVHMFHCCFSSFCTSLSTRFVLLLASDSRLMQTLIRIPTHYSTLLRSKQETVELQETCTKAKVFNLLLQHLGPVATSTCMPLYLCPPLQRVCVYVYVSIRPSSMSLWRCPPLQRVCLYVSVRPSNVYVSMFLSAPPMCMSLCLCPPLQCVCFCPPFQCICLYVSVRPSNVYVSMALSAPPMCMSLSAPPMCMSLCFCPPLQRVCLYGFFRHFLFGLRPSYLQALEISDYGKVCVCVCWGGVACVG